MAGMYIHIPFCKQACSYCNFHFSTSQKNRERLVDSICKEIAARADYLPSQELSSIYFGGGTPSIVETDQLEKIFDTIAKNYDLSHLKEVTLEANPDDLTDTKLQGLKRLPIDRFSIGIQSFQQNDLEFMNRAHSVDEGIDSIKRAQDAGFEKITLDLIFGIPTSNLNQWEKNLQLFFELGIPHLSSYALTLEEKTVYWDWVQKGKVEAPNEEEVALQYQILQTYIKEKGWEHYELSNYCQPGSRAIHNTAYWTGESYIGIGPSAHSYNEKSRQWNLSNNALYSKQDFEGEDYFEKEELSVKERYHELLINRLRTSFGVKLIELEENYSKEVKEHFMKQAKSVEEFLLLKEGSVAIKEQYWLTSDEIIRKLMMD